MTTIKNIAEKSSRILRESFENASRIPRESFEMIVAGIFLILLLLGIGYTVETYVIPVLPWMWSSSGSLLSWFWVSSWSILSWLWSVSLWILLIFACLFVLCIVIDKHETKKEKKRLFVERMKRGKLKKAADKNIISILQSL